MKGVLLTRAALIAGACVASSSQAQVSVCEQAHRGIVGAEQSWASRQAEGSGDNSAPRATLRELQILKELQLIAIYMEILRSNSCPPLKRLPSYANWFIDALQCEVAIKGAVLKGANADLPPACDPKNWKGLSK
jgi:hypothetical protein